MIFGPIFYDRETGLRDGPPIRNTIMLKVIAQDFIKPEAVALVTPLYAELVALTRQEERCIAYDLYVDQKDPGHFVFVEEWPDCAALDAHCRSEHFTRLVPLINAHQRRDCIVTLMEPFQAPGSAQ